MIKKICVLLLLCCCCAAGWLFYSHKEEATNIAAVPAPIGEDEEKFKEIKERWWELIHTAAPGTDWRAIEASNRSAALQERQSRLQQMGTNRTTTESFANGQLLGEWGERGSANIAEAL